MPSKPSTGSVTATASVPEAIRRGLSRITFRLLAFNLLLVFLPALGILSLRTYEAHLLDLQERSMVQQGRILAAALGGNEELVAGKAERILVNLNQQQESRLRIVDHEYQLLADSSRLGPRSTDDPGEIDSDAEPEVRSRRLYQLGTLLYRGYSFIFGVDRASDAPPRPSTLISSEGRLESPELALALDGRYGGAIRPSPTTRSLILYSALPITSGDEVIGAVLVSRSTLGILEALYDFRLSVFQVITASVAAAIVLSLLMATTIARPLRRLQLEANALLDRRGRLRRRFTASRRRDEIGDLSRALAELTRRLEGHLRFIEGFASDVSHELKNPLASIRNVVELLDDVDDPHERKRFMTMALREIARLEHLVNSVREITLIDARLEQESVAPVALEPLLRTLIEPIALRHERVDFELAATDEELVVTASPRRLAQVFENLLDNATSFSPPDGTVTVELTREDGMATVRVRDQGPGIPAAHQDKVFQRFFSYRPNGGKGHTGLGLSIVRAIVESYGGGIAIEAVAGDATEGDNSGAVFVVRLPLTL